MNITQFGKKAADKLATATNNGLLAALDFVKLQRLTSNTISGVDIPGWSIGQDSAGRGMARAYQNDAIVTAKNAFHVGANVYFDGTNWQRYDTAKPAHILVWRDTSIQYELYYALAGANPVTWISAGSFGPSQLALAMNPPRARAWGNGTSQTVNNVTVTPILFNATITNNGGAGGTALWAAGSPGRLTAAVAGIYEVGGTLTYANVGGGTGRFAFLRVNATTIIGSGTGPVSATQNVRVSAHALYPLNAGDYMELCAYQDSGGSMSVVGSGQETSFYMQYHSPQ